VRFEVSKREKREKRVKGDVVIRSLGCAPVVDPARASMVGAVIARGALAYGLRPREAEVILEAALGHDPEAIRSRLGIAPSTFRTHVSALSRAVGVRGLFRATTLVFLAGVVCQQVEEERDEE
jgi:DNA-binding CsgD family transcriptional regulator